MPDALEPQATVLGKRPWALFSVLFSRASFIRPILFLEDNTPNRLNPA